MKMNKDRAAVYGTDTKALMDDAAFQTAYRMVSAERRRRTDRFVFRKDKMLSLAAGLLLQKGLRDRGIIDGSIAYEAGGKPYLSDMDHEADGKGQRRPIHFNLSHSEEKVMCVISDTDVGCDVEKVTDVDLEIARRFFFTTEYETISAGETSEQQQDLFYRLWTLKESFMKATGLGMALPLDAFRVELKGTLSETAKQQSAVLFHKVNEKRYRFKEYDVGDGYRYAVCGLAGGEPFPSEMETVDLLKLLSEGV